MTCRQLIDFLTDYVDGDLPAEQRRQFDAHLEECGECRRYVTQFTSTVKLTHAAAAEDVPEALPPELVKAILRAANK